MKFSVIISKKANFYFFVQNLSEWHFSCRKKYNEIWYKLFPSLKNKRKKDGALFYLKDFFRKHEKYDGLSNFPLFKEVIEKNSLNFASLNLKERAVIQKKINLFKPEFEKIWEKNISRLKEFSHIFKKQKYRELLKRGERILKIYFGEPPRKKIKKINIYPLVIPEGEYGGGGANIGPDKITIEIGNISEIGIRWTLGVILHEITHLFYEDKINDLLRGLIKSIPKEEKDLEILKIFGNNLEIIFKEIIIFSIIGEGIINEMVLGFPTEEHLRNDVQKINWKDSLHPLLFRKIASIYLRKTNEKYLKLKKEIDVNYLKEVWRFIKRFNERYKTKKSKDILYF